MSKRVLGVAVVMSAFLAAAAMAGTATPNLDKREHRQMQRIHQGVQSGELTRPETRRLTEGEARLRYNEAKAKADGDVTPAERARLQAEADRMSKRIYRQKHDAQTRGN
jgi:uncharacterized membrane protein YebE (DUF533 family)